MASGWNLWVWLECIGVVSGWCCIRRYIDILIIIITFPYSTCICSFFGSIILISLFIFKMCIYIYVGRKAWICPIHGLRCANHGSVLCVGNPWIVLS